MWWFWKGYLIGVFWFLVVIFAIVITVPYMDYFWPTDAFGLRW